MDPAEPNPDGIQRFCFGDRLGPCMVARDQLANAVIFALAGLQHRGEVGVNDGGA